MLIYSSMQAMDLELLKLRSNALSHIRSFFSEKTFLELDTPSLSRTLIPESCLEVFETHFIEPFNEKQQKLYLLPSPELYIKRIIAEHKLSVFQISKCYRNVESIGRLHSPEFTMLEYYSVNANYMDSLFLTEALFSSFEKNRKISSFFGNSLPDFLKPPFIQLSMNEAFKSYAGFYLDDCKSSAALAEEARRLGLYESKENPLDSWQMDDLYELIFVSEVEPKLPTEKPVALMDYPSFVPCLAEDKDEAHKERWELYIRGIELANCYSEERDSAKVKAYFESEGKIKMQKAIVKHPIDADYYKTFYNFPRCSGVALGFERLLMLLAGKSSIDSVLPVRLF